MNSYPTLVQGIYTKRQCYILITNLEAIKEELYKSSLVLTQLMSDHLSLELSEEILNLLKVENTDITDRQSLVTVFESLISYLKNLPIVALTLTYSPTLKQLLQISEWFVTEVKAKILIEVRVDPSIIAGATIQYKGIYKN